MNLGPFCPKGPCATNTALVVAIHTTTCSTAFSPAGKTNTVLLLALTVFAFTTAQQCGRFLRCKQCNRITLDWSALFSLLFFRNSRAFFRSGRSSRLKHSSQQHKDVHSRPARKHSQYLAITHPPTPIQFQTVCLLTGAVNGGVSLVTGGKRIIRTILLLSGRPFITVC